MKEIWADVKGYEDCYQVSNFGSVRSKDRIVKADNGHGVFDRKIKGKLLKLNKNRHGYFGIELYKNGDFINTRIHRLVYENFISIIPEGYIIHHKDENTSNNKLNNLEMVTHKKHCQIHPRKAWNKNKKMPEYIANKPKLSKAKKQLYRANQMEKHKNDGLSTKEISEIFNCTEQTIQRTLKLKNHYQERIKKLEGIKYV